MFGRKKDPEPMTSTNPASTDTSLDPLAPKPLRRIDEPGPRPLGGSGPTNRPIPAPPGGTPVKRVEGPDEGKKLIVGRDISLSGKIASCDRLVVEGSVEASLNDCRAMEIAEVGVFKGDADVETAEISGRFEGTLNVRDRLYIRAAGKVTGQVRYGTLEIERGGQVIGDLNLLTGADTIPLNALNPVKRP
jgi:cytoskeletal protein CcmA (bactofilin family)